MIIHMKCSWLAIVVCWAQHNASDKYYVVLTFHGLVLIFARIVVVACKKIYGHLIRMYFVSSILFFKLNMKTWNGQPTTLIEFRSYCLSSQFYPRVVLPTKLLFVLCNSTLSVAIVSAHTTAWREWIITTAQHFIVSLQYIPVTTKKMLDHPIWRNNVCSNCMLRIFSTIFGIHSVLYNHSRHTILVLKTFSHLWGKCASSSTIQTGQHCYCYIAV